MSSRRAPLLSLDDPLPPPRWALLERHVLDAEAAACRDFFAKYFDPHSGYLLAVPRWGGDDGPDDAAENQLNWTTLYALGGAGDLLDMFRTGFEGHLRQYTEARTVEVPMAREGMYYKEFPVSLDWFHHGEGLSAYLLYGLCDPWDPDYERRFRRWTAMYDGTDETAPNYDPGRRIVRSMFTGSRGPLLRKATALDWAGDPIAIEGRFRLGHGERDFAEMLAHFEEYTDVVGDHPLNLEATHLGLVAYLITGDDRYRGGVVDYIDAWVQHTEDNGGIIPSNIGLDGTIGGATGGRWWGGCYGWGFTVTVPQTEAAAHRPACYSRPHFGFAHGLLLTGQQAYVDTWRGVLDKVNGNAREEDGRTLYPHMHGDDGWYDFRPQPFSPGAQEIWFWSQREDDRERVAGDGWVRYLAGEEPGYPEAALESVLEQVRTCMGGVAQDESSPDTRLSDDMNHLNPARTDTLVNLILGGLPVGRSCHTLHCRLRYFDPETRRSGLPPQVAALVDGMSDGEVSVQLVNLDPVRERHLVVQGGAYGEHRIQRVTAGDGTPIDVPGEGSSFAVRLAPGAGGRLSIAQNRYSRQPTFAFPWER